MIILKKQWKKVINATSEVDLTFLLLRVLSLAGGIAWLLIVPLAPREKAILVKALVYFPLTAPFATWLFFAGPAC